MEFFIYAYIFVALGCVLYFSIVEKDFFNNPKFFVALVLMACVWPIIGIWYLIDTYT